MSTHIVVPWEPEQAEPAHAKLIERLDRAERDLRTFNQKHGLPEGKLPYGILAAIPGEEGKTLRKRRKRLQDRIALIRSDARTFSGLSTHPRFSRPDGHRDGADGAPQPLSAPPSVVATAPTQRARPLPLAVVARLDVQRQHRSNIKIAATAILNATSPSEKRLKQLALRRAVMAARDDQFTDGYFELGKQAETRLHLIEAEEAKEAGTLSPPARHQRYTTAEEQLHARREHRDSIKGAATTAVHVYKDPHSTEQQKTSAKKTLYSAVARAQKDNFTDAYFQFGKHAQTRLNLIKAEEAEEAGGLRLHITVEEQLRARAEHLSRVKKAAIEAVKIYDDARSTQTQKTRASRVLNFHVGEARKDGFTDRSFERGKHAKDRLELIQREEAEHAEIPARGQLSPHLGEVPSSVLPSSLMHSWEDFGF